MTKQEAPYLSYLLRIWSSTEGEQTIWRASLESPHTGERLGFSTLDHLFDFLQDQTGEHRHGPASTSASSR